MASPAVQAEPAGKRETRVYRRVTLTEGQRDEVIGKVEAALGAAAVLVGGTPRGVQTILRFDLAPDGYTLRIRAAVSEFGL